MEPRLAARPKGEGRARAEGPITSARPLVRPAPRAAMFFPLVVLVAVLPGLYALTSWDLTPPGPWWGLRGLAVLDGFVIDQVPAVAQVKPGPEAEAFGTVTLQPPLYAWLEAVGLWLSGDRDPRATVLPSYIAGALVVVLVYLHGRLWHSAGMGLIAAVLMGFNRHLLIQMQQATPTTLGLAGTLTALLAYAWHLRAGPESSPSETAGWTALGGFALGLALMAMGGFGLIVVPVILLHQVYLRAEGPAGGKPGRWWLAWRTYPSLTAGAVALALGLAIAVPWHIWMYVVHGPKALSSLLAPFDGRVWLQRGLAATLVELAPATAPLGLYAAARMIRLALIDEMDDRKVIGGVFWVLWLAVAALGPAIWPNGPRPTFGLFLAVPLNLLAAQAISDLANRRIAIRTLTYLAPATAVTVAWWNSANLRGAINDLTHLRADATTALGLHLAVDLLIAAVLLTRWLDRWARRRDDRQRRVLGGFLSTIAAITLTMGVQEVCFRHRETDDLLMLRTMVIRRNREQPFDYLAVVSPEASRQGGDSPVPGGRLRFILRSALPHLAQHDLTSTDDLLSLPKGQRLVILAGASQRLSYAVQSRLGLEAIHPGRSGVLDAFATATVIADKRAR